MTNWKTEAIRDLGGVRLALEMQLNRVNQAVEELETLTDGDSGKTAWNVTRESIVAHIAQIGHAFRWCCENPECPNSEDQS